MAATASSERGDTSRSTPSAVTMPLERVESAAHVASSVRARAPARQPRARPRGAARAARASAVAAASPCAVARPAAHREQPVGDLDIAETTTTGGGSARRARRPSTMPISAADGVRVGDRRAAEFHHDVASHRSVSLPQLHAADAHHSSPSACISSAFRIAAPAAPRIVLWPSATNL